MHNKNIFILDVEIEREDLEPIVKDDFTEGLELPFCNRDASTVSEIYLLEDLIPKDVLQTLCSIANEIAENEVLE